METKEQSLVKNSVYNVAYKLLNVFFPLISSVYISHILLAEGVGRVAYAQNIVTYFTTLAALGLPNYGVREIAKIHLDFLKTQKIFSELFIVNTISTLVCGGLYYLIIFFVPRFNNDLLLYFVVGLPIIFNFINVDWFFQGEEEYGYIAFRSFIIKVVSLIALFLFVRNKNDVVIYALILSLATCGNYIFNIFRLRKYKIKLQLKNIDIMQHIKPVIIMLGTTLAIELYTLLDTTMIGIFCSDVYVGYYTNTMKLVKVIITVITAIGSTLLPRLSYYHMIGENLKCEKIVNYVFAIMLFLFIPCQIGMIICSDAIIPILFGNSFLPAVNTFKIASFLICTLGFSNLFGTQILLTFGEEKKLFVCTILGAITNIILNSFLIPMYQQNGAAFASVISEAVVTITTYILAKRYIKIRLSRKFVNSIFCSAFIMILVLVGIKSLLRNMICIYMLVSIIIGCIIYFGCNWGLKNEILEDIISFSLNKWRKYQNRKGVGK